MKWKHVWKRALRSVVFVVGSVYGTGLALGILFADRMIFLPRPASYTLNEPFFLLPMHDGNQVCVRHVRNPDARYTILYSHGNAEDIGELGEVLEAFKAHGYAVVAYDYSGYGMSTGAPSEQAAYANIMTVYDYLTEDEKLRPEQIVVFGRSVGGGPSVELAATRPVGALVLESAFTSAFRVLTRIKMFPIDKFDNIHKIASVSCPVLIIHGRRDEIIPFHHGKALYDRAASPKMHFWVDSARHNDVMWAAGRAYWKTLAEFIDSL